jgi:hypothetical protein
MLRDDDARKHGATCQNRSLSANDFGKLTPFFVNLYFVACSVSAQSPWINQRCMHIAKISAFLFYFKSNCNIFQSCLQLKTLVAGWVNFAVTLE